MMSNKLFFEEAFLHKLERLSILYRQAARGPHQGERRSSKRGQSVEFSDFRPYTSGDDFRRIDWNAYARLERFFIKLFVEEQDLTVHLLLDASQSMDWGEPNKQKFATQAAGALGYIALLGLDRVRLCVLGTPPFPITRGKRSALNLFTRLDSIDTALSKGSPTAWLHAYAANAGTPGPLVLFSDLLGDGWQKGLQILAGRGFDITLMHILSPDEVRPDLEGDLKLLDSESGSALEVTADYNLLSRYIKDLQSWRSEWARFSAMRSMHYIPLESSLTLDDLLFAVLPARGVLQ